MYDGDKAVLTMVQYLKEDKEKDENIYEATVIEYQKEMEQVHLILRSGSLSYISLDAVYECRIHSSPAGPESYLRGVVDGKEVTMNVSVGDKVIYSKYAGTEVELDDEEYIIVKQNDILAVIR